MNFRFKLGRALLGLLVSLSSLWAQSVITPPVTPVDLPPVWPGPIGSTPATAPQLMGINGGGSVELGQKVTLSVLFWSPTDLQSYTYQWKKGEADIPGATSTTYVIAAAVAGDSGTYTVKVTNSDGSSVTSTDVTVKSAAAPVITSAPGNLVRQIGQQAVFTYAATGSYPRTHQWRRNGVDLPGATDSSYTIDAVKVDHAGTYSVVVTNSLGSATSASASLTVNAATPVVLSPDNPRDTTVVQGATIYLSAYSTGGSAPFTYQWKKNGVPLPDSNSAQLTISAATLSDAGRYSVTVTNPAGSATSREATVTITAPTPVTIQLHPRDQTIYEGQDASFNVSVNGSSPVTYQWKKNGSPVSGATNNYFSINRATLADAGTYTVTVGNAAGSVTSNSAILTVNRAIAPTISQQPMGQTLNYSDSLNLSVTVTGSPPFTYQWKKDGVAIQYATSSSYGIYNATPANSGAYIVVVTNAAGSVTSASATVTVKAAAAPAITKQPVGQTLAYGSSLDLSVTVTGSPPLSFQWKKDGVALQNGTYSDYSVYHATTADSGIYTVVITNAAGSVTSQGATVTVQAAVAPKITEQPQSQTLLYGAYLSLSVRADGSPPLTYQWKKDGVSLGANGTSNRLSSWDTTPANSGTYVVVVTNPAGSVTSAAAVVTVKAAAVPTITTQPVSKEVATGLPASFYASVNSSGAGPLTYQWRKNGSVIPGATSSRLDFDTVTGANAGDYTLVVTGPGGAVTSDIAKLTVLPPAPPRITYYSSYGGDASASIGSYTSLNFNTVEGSPPFSYQWLKNGVPIPGATSASLTFNQVTADDFAVYVLTVSNEAGVAASPPVRLQLSPYDTMATPWLDAGRVGDVVYFLATVPSRIERFDLAAERWLPTVLLSDTLVPTAFAPASEGIYVAYGRTLVRRSLDLATETPLTNTASSNTLLFALGNFLYYDGNGSSDYSRSYGSLNRTTLQPGPVVAPSTIYADAFRNVAVAPSLGKVFARSVGSSPSDIVMFKLAADGSVTEAKDSPYHGDFAPANRTFIFPGEARVADDSGTIYSTTDLSFVGGFGSRFTDLAFLDDGSPVVLRQQTLTLAKPDSTLETSRVALPQDALRLFTQGSTVFAFGTPLVSGGSYRVTKVARSAFVAIPGGGPAEAPVGRYSVDDAFLGAEGVVHVFSRSLRGLVRWSAETRSLLPMIALRDVPAVAAQQPGQGRALFAYLDGVITALPLRAAAADEGPLGVLNLRVRAMVDLGDRAVLNVSSSQSSGDMRAMLGPTGFDGSQWQSRYYGNVLAWLGSSRRLYSAGTFSANTIQYEVVPESGPLAVNPVKTASSLTPPIRFNPEGTLAATANGRVVNADLDQVGVLANDILDAAWLPDGLYTLRSFGGETQVQQWIRSTYLLKSSVRLPGVPVRLFRLSDAQLVVVTSRSGVAAFTVINADLSISTSPTPAVQVTSQPRSQTVSADGSASFSVAQQGSSGTVSYQWRRNGAAVSGATSSSYSVAHVQPANTGLYSAILSDTTATTQTDPAILGVSTTSKVIGDGTELAPNVIHPNGNAYDQILPSAAAVSITADPNQVTRTSFIDMNDDIVQVEFSGAGTLSIVLAGASAPAEPVNYNQSVKYVKGHAGIVITGANETTNVSVFSIGRATAFDPTGTFNILQAISAANDPGRNGSPLFQGHEATAYDGVADIAFIAILSNNGKFGGIRAANANFFASSGFTGIYAPGIQFSGPVYVGNITAFGEATPMLITGAATDARITGGEMLQTNSRAVKITGISQLKFVDGSTSHGALLPAQRNQGRYEQNGSDVTDQIVVNPNP